MITMLHCTHCDWKVGVTQPIEGLDVTLIHKGFMDGSVLHEVVITFKAGFLERIHTQNIK